MSNMALSKGKGFNVNGIYELRRPEMNISSLTDKDRTLLAKLIKAGHTKGFIDREVDGERYIWELNFRKDQ